MIIILLELNTNQLQIIKESLSVMKSLYESKLEVVGDILKNVYTYEHDKKELSKNINMNFNLDEIYLEIKKILFKKELTNNKEKNLVIEEILFKLENDIDLEREEFFLVLDSVELNLRLNIGQVEYINSDFYKFSTSSMLDVEIYELNKYLVLLKKAYLPHMEFYESFSVFNKSLPKNIVETYNLFNFLKIKKTFYSEYKKGC